MRQHHQRSSQRGAAAAQARTVDRRNPLIGLQGEAGNRSVAGLLETGDIPALTALANRSSIGNGIVQRHLASSSTVPAPFVQRLAAGTRVTATVTSIGLNVRKRPSASAQKVGELLNGDTVDVLGRSGPWLRVRFGGGEGWISSRFVRVDEAPAPAPAEKAEAAPGGAGPPGTAPDPVSQLWDQIRAWWGAAAGEGQATTAAAGAKAGAKAEKAAEAAGEVPAPTGELDELMTKATLSPEEIEKARALIDGVEDEQRRGDLYEALQAKTEYRSQRDNEATTAGGAKIETSGGNMCNLTSLAMCLSYLGVANPRPEMQYEDALEKIRQEKGFGARTTADGWGKLANELGVTYDFLGTEVTEDKTWWVANALPALRSGKAVMLSISGHICRLQAVNDEGLVADDPYGASKLLAGGDHKWTFTKKNAYGESGQLAGNDVLWPWADVAKHTMRWIAAFKR